MPKNTTSSACVVLVISVSRHLLTWALAKASISKALAVTIGEKANDAATKAAFPKTFLLESMMFPELSPPQLVIAS